MDEAKKAKATKTVLWATAAVLAGCYRGRAEDRACLLHAVEVDEGGGQKPGSLCRKVREPEGAQTKLITDGCAPGDLPTCEECLRRVARPGAVRFEERS